MLIIEGKILNTEVYFEQVFPAFGYRYSKGQNSNC